MELLKITEVRDDVDSTLPITLIYVEKDFQYIRLHPAGIRYLTFEK